MDSRPPILLAVFGALLLTQIAASASDLAFLGPKGSYSDEAASIWASRDHITGTLPLSTISAIAESVRDGRVEFGLLPFENSIGGFVGETQKLLLAAPDLGWRIIGDITIPISNNLLVKPGTKASDLKKVISHPEALKECHELRGNRRRRTQFLRAKADSPGCPNRGSKRDGHFCPVARRSESSFI